MKLRFTALVAVLSLFLLPAANGQDRLTVFAAASLGDVLPELAAAWPRGRALRIIPVYGPSATLARQIATGAPADIFISANPDWVQHVRDKRGVTHSGIVTARNQLVLVVPLGRKVPSDEFSLTPEAMTRLLDSNRMAIANPNTAPAGQYARNYLRAIGLWNDFQDRIVLGNSVRQALLYVERGGLSGLVYRTDALASEKVRILAPIPLGLSGPIDYQAVAVTAGAEAKAFLSYLSSDESTPVWRRHGFLPTHH